jgi:iron complex outermembrane receptor protein
MKLKPLALCIALPPCLASAAEIPVLDEILVTAPKADLQPLSASRISEGTLARMRASTSDSASLLRDIPGVNLQSAGGVSSLPVIHGLADDRLRIKVDGMDFLAACPNHMNSPLSYIDPSAVTNAKVYAGISPVSVGGDSIGGSIVVESAAPEFAKAGEGKLLKGEAGAFYRSNGDAKGANLAATIATEQTSISYSGSIAKADNYKAGGDFKTSTVTGRVGHTLPLDEVGSTAYETVNQALKLAWKNDDHLFEFKYGRQQIPFENFPNQRMDMTDNTSDQFNLAYTGKQGWGTLKGRVYYEHTRHEMDFGDDKRFWYGTGAPPTGSGGLLGGDGLGNGFPCSPISMSCAAGMPMLTEGRNTGINFSADIWLAQGGTLRVGGEYQRYRLDDWWPPSGAGMWPGTFWNINDGQRDRHAVFGEWETHINPQWTSLLGMRHETVEMDTDDVRGYNTAVAAMGNQYVDMNAFNAKSHGKTDRNWDLTWLGRHTPDTTQTYEIGLAQKTRSPNLYERYTWSTWTMAAVMNNYVGDGNGYVGNLDLKPEVARTLSLSADWHDAGRKQWGLKVSPHYSRVHDYIDARCLPGATCTPSKFNVLQYVNQSARLYGVDISGHVLLADTPGHGDFTASGMLNYTKGENRDTGDKLFNIMPLNAKLAITHRLGAWRNTLEGQFVARKNDVSRVRNEMETPGYGLINLRGRYEQKRYSLDFGIENLFDRNYALPLGGAYSGQGTTMSINGIPWGIPVPGPGRSFYAGLNFKF